MLKRQTQIQRLTRPAALSAVIWIIFTRDSIYAIARICYGNSVRPSVCPSHACIVFKRLNISSTVGQWGRSRINARRPICRYISETVTDRGIFTIEDEYKVVCALSNSAAFDDLH